MEDPDARRWAVQIPGALLDDHVRRAPDESYSFRGGDVTHSSGYNPVKAFTGFIAISGWRGAIHTQTLVPGAMNNPFNNDQKDTFVTYTNRENNADTDYLDFGYWYRTLPHDGDKLDSFRLIAVGSMRPDPVEQVTGSATYSGPATGVYAKMSRGVYTQSGQFTAETSLQAVFEDPSAEEDDRFGVSGTISNFRNNRGNLIDSSWTVTLNKAVHDPIQREPDNFVAGKTSRGGDWKFQYFGPVLVSGGDPIAPSAIAGSFVEEFTNGNVAGAFAATKN